MEDLSQLWKGYRLQGTNGKTVFLINGYTGTPAELYTVASYLNQDGYSIIAPQIAGHTTSKEDLKKTTYKDWLASIEASYLKARKENPILYVLGLSMGGAMALIIDEDLEEKPDALILYEPCLTIRNKASYVSFLFKDIVPVVNFSKTDLPDGNEKYLQNDQGFYTSKLKDLVMISNKARKNLDKVTAPFLCFFSLNDSMITSRGIKELIVKAKSPNKNLHVLSGNEHMIQIGYKEQEVLKATKDYLNCL
ncbi:MAG: alpha/beta fold hydrolase [Bacilli bacterium]|jgi:carboxylesterase